MQYPKLVEHKTLSNSIQSIEWNPGMDLLATVYENGSITCSRLLSLQKQVWQKQPNDKIISITWRPDGRVLAVAIQKGDSEGICTLHDVENGNEIYTIHSKTAITSIEWFQYSNPEEEDKDQEDSTKLRKALQSFESQDNFSHQLAHEQTQLNILMISNSSGTISCYALGLFYLGEIQIHHPGSSNGPLTTIKTHMSSDMRFISSVMYMSDAQEFTSVKIVKMDTLHRRSNEILRVAKMYAKITDELEYLDDAISAITTSWTDVLAGLDNKLSSYCSRKGKNLDGDSSGYTFLSADELLQLLVLGYPSDNLEKFLVDMSDKGLKKLNNAIEQTCLRVQNLIVKNSQKCCYHLHSDLNILRGMSLWRDRFKDVGLDDKTTVAAMRAVGSLLLKLTELQQVIDHSLKSTKSFFRWLISIACRMSGEQNNSIVPNDINKTTQQDIQLITDFILENFDYNSAQEGDPSFLGHSDSQDKTMFTNRPTCSNFTLEQVGQYFKNEPLSRLKYSFAKPDSNFWIEFFKKRLEPLSSDARDASSALLFYPHSPETSLIQDYKRACKSIQEAFNSVAKGIQLLPSETNNSIAFHDHFRHLKRDEARKIEIEIDTRHMCHYTLYPGGDDKYNLIAYLLNDKTFKLISIAFHVDQDPDSKARARISDAGFYEDKETKKLLLSFLLTKSKNTIIVQVDLNNLLERIKDCEKLRTDLRYRSGDNRSNFHLIEFHLDIYSEPAHERCHKPGDCPIMVKKINGISGEELFTSSGRGLLAIITDCRRRLHLYELESIDSGLDVMDDDELLDREMDESLIDTEMAT